MLFVARPITVATANAAIECPEGKLLLNGSPLALKNVSGEIAVRAKSPAAASVALPP